MRIFLDTARCMGSGSCVLASASVFTIGAEGTVELLKQPDESLRAQVEAAARACPGAVISIIADDEEPARPD